MAHRPRQPERAEAGPDPADGGRESRPHTAHFGREDFPRIVCASVLRGTAPKVSCCDGMGRSFDLKNFSCTPGLVLSGS